MSVRVPKKCEVLTEAIGMETPEGAIPLLFGIACGGSYVPYESLFNKTRVTGTLLVGVSNSSCTFTVTIDRGKQQPITAAILPTDTERTINVTADCIRKITFSCKSEATPPPTTDCHGSFNLQLHWCKCC